MIFADNNTLWIGSSQCANGVRAATAATELATQGYTDQAGNYNCLTAVSLGATPTAQIVPVVVQSNIPSVTPVTVAYPNTDQNLYYYGSLTGICWVQGFGKVYTADGGQIHAFYTGGTSFPGALTQEVNNYNITIQGTVLDVAYMDALTNSAN
jgi:4-amino-4-deoxy-L-arabinose transferase-like glycosyltransferase